MVLLLYLTTPYNQTPSVQIWVAWYVCFAWIRIHVRSTHCNWILFQVSPGFHLPSLFLACHWKNCLVSVVSQSKFCCLQLCNIFEHIPFSSGISYELLVESLVLMEFRLIAFGKIHFLRGYVPPSNTLCLSLILWYYKNA